MKKFLSFFLAFAHIAMPVIAVAAGTTDNTYSIGNGAAGDKKVIFNKGSGAANPQIKWSNTDQNLQFSLDGSTFKNFGSGSGGGGTNYVTNSDAESNTTGWTTGADAAAASPADGTGGTAASGFTFTRTTTNPLKDKGSFLITHPASNTQGTFVSFDFKIDRQDMGKTLNISFPTELVSGTYNSGTAYPSYTTADITAFIYDRDNSALIPVSNPNIGAGVVGAQTNYTASFATTTTADDYRLILYSPNTTTTAFVLKIDEVKVGPQSFSTGVAFTDPVAFQPTGSWTGNVGYSGTVSRQGKFAVVTYNIKASGAPSPSTSLYLNPPPGLSVDVNAVAGTDVVFPAGTWTSEDAGVLNYHGTAYVLRSTGAVFLVNGPNSANVTPTSPWSVGASDFFNVVVRYPIVGWGSTVQMASAEAQRPVSFAANPTSNQVLGTAQAKVNFGTVLNDTHGGWNSGLSRYVVPVSGVYSIKLNATYNDLTAGEIIDATVTVNGNMQTRAAVSAGGIAGVIPIHVDLPLKAGDYLEFYVDAVADASWSILAGAYTSLSATCLTCGGGMQFAANEPVRARYSTSAGSLTSTSTVFDWGSKEYDNRGSVSGTGTSWRFTAPVPGVYRVSAQMGLNNGGGWNAGEYMYCKLQKNGVNYSDLFLNYQVTTHASQVISTGTDTIQLAAGDYIATPCEQTSGASISVIASPSLNHISIELVQ